MNGIFKAGLITVPALGLIIYLGWYAVQELSRHLDTESAALDRDWNEGMASMSKTKGDRRKYLDRAAAAQTQFSSSRDELKAARRKSEQIGKDLDRSANETGQEDLEKALKAQAGGGSR